MITVVVVGLGVMYVLDVLSNFLELQEVHDLVRVRQDTPSRVVASAPERSVWHPSRPRVEVTVHLDYVGREPATVTVKHIRARDVQPWVDGVRTAWWLIR